MSGRRLLAVVCAVVVAAAVGAGLWVNGSPAQQRMALMDSERVNMVRNLSSRVELFADLHHKLPETLEAVSPERSVWIDPETKVPIEYKTSGRRYTLCAVFATMSDAATWPGDTFGRHAKGRVCFDRSLDARTLPPDPSGEHADP